MDISIGKKALCKLIALQLRNNFFLENEEQGLLVEGIELAIMSTEKCLSGINMKYISHNNNRVLFDPYHSVQYTIFLYYLSRRVWEIDSGSKLASKIFYLNKMLNACDLFYEIDLPDVFLLSHPVGSVIGRGKFSNYFIFQQNCTVGSNNNIFPSFGEYVWLHAGVTIIGDSNIGKNVFVAADAYIKDTDIPDNSIVFGKSPNLIIKQRPADYFFSRSPFFDH